MLRTLSLPGKNVLQLLELSIVPTHFGPVLYIWFRNQMDPGDPLTIIAVKTQTVPDLYPLSNVADFTTRLHGCKIFTKLDLTKGYFKVPMSPGDIAETAVITLFGLFKWLCMPFGLCNTGCTIKCMMDMILGDLPYCFIYIDDILIPSPDAESHLLHVLDVLDLLHLNGLRLNSEKCLFTAPEVEYLGMRVSSSGCVPLTEHTKIISNYPRPVDKKRLQRLLGILNFYHHFI